MTTIHKNVTTPKRQLSLFDCISIIVGIVIGAGIYETTPIIAKSVPGPLALVIFWIIGGVISLIGAVCYAELATAYPKEGGDYVFLTRAYGKRMGFLFAWAGFWLVRPANIGAIAYIFARYAEQLWPLPFTQHDMMVYTVISILILTLINVMGVSTGKWTQNLFSTAKVLGLLLLIIIGLVWTVPSSNSVPVEIKTTDTDLSLAFILILFTYGGWSNISYVAAEVKQPTKNILRALLLSTGLITLIYVFTNLAFIRVLGFDGVAGSSSVASDVLSLSFGDVGAVIISALICITCLGNINGMIFTDSRIYYAMGQDHRLYGWLGQWSKRYDSPVRALVMQAIMTLILVIGLGFQADAFERLVVFSAPLHWLFFLLVAFSLFILRIREPDSHRPYRVPLYPLVPILFCASSLYMLYASMTYAYEQRHPEAYGIIIVMLIGIVASLYDPAKERKT